MGGASSIAGTVSAVWFVSSRVPQWTHTQSRVMEPYERDALNDDEEEDLKSPTAAMQRLSIGNDRYTTFMELVQHKKCFVPAHLASTWTAMHDTLVHHRSIVLARVVAECAKEKAKKPEMDYNAADGKSSERWALDRRVNAMQPTTESSSTTMVMACALDYLMGLILDRSSRWNGEKSMLAMGFACLRLAIECVDETSTWYVQLAPSGRMRRIQRDDARRMRTQVSLQLEWRFASCDWLRLFRMCCVDDRSDVDAVPRDHPLWYKWNTFKHMPDVLGIKPLGLQPLSVHPQGEWSVLLNTKLLSTVARTNHSAAVAEWTESPIRMELEATVLDCMGRWIKPPPRLSWNELIQCDAEYRRFGQNVQFLCLPYDNKRTALLTVIGSILAPAVKRKRPNDDPNERPLTKK